MAEIIDITQYFRTCANCVFYKHGPDRACGHPGGWTVKIKNMYSIECNEFVNKNKALPGSTGQGKGYGSQSNRRRLSKNPLMDSPKNVLIET